MLTRLIVACSGAGTRLATRNISREIQRNSTFHTDRCTRSNLKLDQIKSTIIDKSLMTYQI